jgi:hypothetical protein
VLQSGFNARHVVCAALLGIVIEVEALARWLRAANLRAHQFIVNAVSARNFFTWDMPACVTVEYVFTAAVFLIRALLIGSVVSPHEKLAVVRSLGCNMIVRLIIPVVVATG